MCWIAVDFAGRLSNQATDKRTNTAHIATTTKQEYTGTQKPILYNSIMQQAADNAYKFSSMCTQIQI